ncbi:class A beta-lactamase-related serine hydrolase [Flavobacteriaceae bacterium AU392]|nr:class A beta-lactamase-related serine hydrolase [Flavobacteriaceae bacterium]RKM84797.1 class A beta-lactamase-related serine hydrolase [Flavobacteriaceae bacterium AU392]
MNIKSKLVQKTLLFFICKIFILITLLFSSCTKKEELTNSITKDVFASEINQLKDYFQIPGLSILIKNDNEIIYEDYLGFANISDKTPLDKTTTIPMASLTKIFSGIVLMQLEEEDILSIEESIKKYIPSIGISDSIKIKHILSHTSQGEIGKQFYYSNRFGLLTSVIEKVAGQTFEEVINTRIINKLQLKNTYLLKDSLQLVSENRKIASPYFLGGEMKNGFLEKTPREGFIDYGFSASAGITSTVIDLGILSDALDNNTLISNSSKEKMTSPFNNKLPYGLGIFTQKFMNKKLQWGYGQYDCYSSLFLKVPDKNLTFIIAANNNLMSDPARLINGDVTTSLFALSFLKNYVFNLPEISLFEEEQSLGTLKNKISDTNSEFYRKKLIAQLSAESYMSRFDDTKTTFSKKILNQLFELFPEYENYGDLNLLFNLQFLKLITTMRDQPELVDFDVQYQKIGKKLLSEDSNNPYANYYMANYYQMKNDIDSTSHFYHKIIDAKNFSPWWYTNEAEQWIKSNKN